MKKRIIGMVTMLLLILSLLPVMTTDVSAKESANPILVVSAKTSGDKAVKLSWTKVKGATKYVVYGARCGKKNVRIATLKKTSCTVKKIGGKKLTAHKDYDFYVVAYKGKKKLVKSDKIRFITAGTQGKYANVKKVTATKKSISLALGKSKKLSYKTVLPKGKKHVKVTKAYKAKTRFYSDNTKVATVTSKGKVKAKTTGKANIYIQDMNGKYCKIKITVKGSQSPTSTPTGEPTATPTVKPTAPPAPVLTYDGLCFTAENTDSSVTLTTKGSPDAISLQYSKNTAPWTDYTIGSKIQLSNVGDKVYFKATDHNATFSNPDSNYVFTMEGKIAASGNIMSLLDATCKSKTIPCDGCFKSLFSACSCLTSAPTLPATKMANNCYSYMFAGCTSIKDAPELPATELANSCYGSMFSKCMNLEKAPELPVTELATYCYNNMFNSCTSMKKAPTLPATELANYCYYGMFSDCTGLTSTPELPATTLAEYCYNCMFLGCSNLTNIPDKLPIMTLYRGCYSQMFRRCTSLATAPELPATTLVDSCYSSMFCECSNLTKAPTLPATILTPNCYASMFDGCTNLTEAPTLPATTLANFCYLNMFKNCQSLITAPELPATTLAYKCYGSMFEGCSSLTSAPILHADELVSGCYNQMFKQCSNLHSVTMLATKGYDDVNVPNALDNWITSSNGTLYKSSAITGDLAKFKLPNTWKIQNSSKK